MIEYETAVKADGFMVRAHGPTVEIARAKTILATINPTRLDVHAGTKARESADLVHG